MQADEKLDCVDFLLRACVFDFGLLLLKLRADRERNGRGLHLESHRLAEVFLICFVKL